jgi:excisionase family DNA binding protein
VGHFNTPEEMREGLDKACSAEQRAAPNGSYSSSEPHAGEPLLTSQEASQVLKIHPKVLERMAKRGEVPALKVGKFWRYRATALDAWINSRIQSQSQPCRMKTSF